MFRYPFNPQPKTTTAEGSSERKGIIRKGIFLIFTPKLGEDEPNLTCAYFSDGLVQPPII